MNLVDRIVSYARVDLGDMFKETGVITKEALDEAVAAAAAYAELRLGLPISEQEQTDAANALEGMFNVYIGNEHVLVNNEGHVEWFDVKRASLAWPYWDRYRRWLIEDEHRPESVVDGSLHPITDEILGLLEDPMRPGAWSRRGLVAGQVQSGKTSNYVGLINKALDAGYKLVVVLAGTHDNLRSQTQRRINTGVLGFDTQGNINGSHGKRVGVGLKDQHNPKINCPTSSAQKGDFNRHVAGGVGALGSDPVILVVKKHTSILANLLAWATGLHHEIDPATGKKIVRDVPMLIIDDEADFASIDTGSKKDKVTGDETDPSATNRLIREILEAFEKTAYVGYTATPFANIYINPSANHEDFGRDLFPEHFIVTLPESSAYSGPAKIFGLVEDEAAGIEGISALPTTRTMDDYEAWLPDGHKKGDLPSGPLPNSLQEALLSFLLASAVKRERRVSMRHNSMLVHVTRFVDVQAAVSDQLEEHVRRLRNEVQFMGPDSDSQVWEELRHLYLGDFLEVNAELARRGDLDAQSSSTPTFAELEPFLLSVIAELQVKTINGEAKDSLQYEESSDGITVIAVGGDKLSRGLTLDGLTTSYYLRASKMYDTLMQMGRWFGYRPGYLDVCRLYTTAQLVKWYSRITSASERLYKEFELMAALGKTPRDFGLRVQAHPDGLMVTSAAKSRFAKNVRASFSGTVSETILFVKDKRARERNADQLRTLYRSMVTDPAVETSTLRNQYWKNVPAAMVLRFLEGYDGHDGAMRALPKAMAEYVRACLSLPSPELLLWDVLIASKAELDERFELANGREIGLIERNPDPSVKPSGESFVIGRLVSSGDELLPLKGDHEREKLALDQAILNWQGSSRSNKGARPIRPTALAERKVRSPLNGFLMVYPLKRIPAELPLDEDPLIGFGVSFPWSENAPSVDYRVNEIYWDLEMARVFEDSSEDDSDG